MSVSAKLTTEAVVAVLPDGMVSAGAHGPRSSRLCIQEAARRALGLDHGYGPLPCQDPAASIWRIKVNDSPWPTRAERTRQALRMLFASLGTVSCNVASGMLDRIGSQRFGDEFDAAVNVASRRRLVDIAVEVMETAKVKAKRGQKTKEKGKRRGKAATS